MRTFTQKPKAAQRTASFSALPRFVHDISLITIHANASATLQRKLQTNTLGDAHEQEADRIAEQVIRMPGARLQRTCACGGGCPRCKDEQVTHRYLQTKRVQANNTGGMAAPPIVHDVLRSSGQPMDLPTRQFMELRFGSDFGHVRIHTDAQAADSARMVNALAYTVGSDIVFGPGQFALHGNQGQRLLAHELAHVLQQQHGPLRMSRQDAKDETPAAGNREAIVATALGLMQEHYLMGAAGQVPGQDAGLSHRKVLLDSKTHKASINVVGTTYECGQRYKQAVNEPCDDKKHFDCGGFVSYCYHSVCPDVKYPGPAAGLLSKAAGWVEKSKDQIAAGDIAYRIIDGQSHVGLCISDKEVVSALGSKWGVVKEDADKYQRFGYLKNCVS